MTAALPRSVCVVGGGLAGIAAALELADQGVEVTLLESRARLGGLTHSFRRGDLWIDGGQHVFMRCCTSYIGLLERLGVRHQTHLQERLDVPIASEASPTRTRLHRNGLPAPLQLGETLLKHTWMSLWQRLLVGRIALALGRLDSTDAAVDAQSFGSWLRAKGADDRSIEVLWELIGKATLNARADDCSLALAAKVFQVGLLSEKSAADLGWSEVPLQQLHGDAAERALRAAGCAIRLRSKVIRVSPRSDGVEISTPTAATRYDAAVLAIPPAALQRIVDPAELGLATQTAERLGLSPIINVHLILDRPVIDTDFIAAVDSPLQWVFDRTRASGLQHGQYLAASISAADELIGRNNAQLREWAMPHLRNLLPGMETAEIIDFFVTREPDATFRAAPGSAQWRATASTTHPRIALAGAWTDTEWPATMEGAVRSGHSAVEALRGCAIPTGGSAATQTAPEHTESVADHAAEGKDHGMTDFARAQELTRSVVTPALHKAVDTLDGQERLVVAYHLGFVDTQGNPVADDGGKKLRPTLTLLSAAALGVDPAQVVSAAVAVELVHNFSLVHDDIMDRDRTRRHRETVWSVWDEATAILAGDALQTLSFETLLADPSPHAAAAAHLLAGTTRELIHGQMLDMDFEQRQRVSLAECRAMAAAKTGVLLACSTEIPAVLVGADREQRSALAAYGRGIGSAFQLIDDLLGIWGDPEVTGKSNHSDLGAKKHSLPISWALEQPGSESLQEWFTSGETTDDELARIATELDEIGAREWCRTSADRAVEDAVAALRSADLEPGAVAGLTQVARYVAGRDV